MIQMYIYIYCFIYFLLLLLLFVFVVVVVVVVNAVFREANIIDYIRDSAFLPYGIKLPLVILVDLCGGGPAYFQSNCQSGGRDQYCSCC